MGRKKGVLLSVLLMIFEVLSTLLLTPFIIRSFGQAEYGVYKLTVSVAAYLMLLDMGIGNAVVRYTAKYHTVGEREQERRFFGVAQSYYTLIALVAGICGAGLTAAFPVLFAKGLTGAEIRLGQILLLIITVNTMVTLATAVFQNIIIGYGLFVVSRGASIIQILLRMALTFGALCLGYKSIAVVMINLLMTILCRSGFAAYVLFRLKLRPTLSGVKKSFVLEVAGYSTWILLQMVATQINAFADQILLGALVSNASVLIAVYGVGVQVVQYFQSIGTAVTGVLMPGVVRMVEHDASQSRLQDEMVRIGRIILLGLLAIWGGFLIYGKQFIELWAGPEYIEGYAVALILMTAYLFILTEAIGTQILWAKNEHKEQAILKFGIVLVNVGLTIVLIRWKPLIGATIGTFVSLIGGDVCVMNLVFKRKIGFNIVSYYRELFRGILPAFVLVIVVNILLSMTHLSGWRGFICNVAAYCMVYIAVIYTLGVNKQEKKMIHGIVQHLLGHILKKGKAE